MAKVESAKCLGIQHSQVNQETKESILVKIQKPKRESFRR